MEEADVDIYRRTVVDSAAQDLVERRVAVHVDNTWIGEDRWILIVNVSGQAAENTCKDTSPVARLHACEN